MENLGFDIFDVKLEDIKKDTTSGSSDANLFKPTPESGRNGTYNAYIRFMPWHKDRSTPVIKKWSVFLEDPVSGKKRSVDCPSTIQEKSVLKDMFFKLYKSNSIREKELAEKFKRKMNCYSLVYIVKDENAPENEGKIMVFRFGQKILDKLLNEMAKPALDIGKERKPFDLFEGRPFNLIVTKKGGYTNYDESYFLDEPYPVKVNGRKISKENITPTELKEWLETASPDLGVYAYKPWDEQTHEFVSEVIRNIVPNGSLIGETLSKPASREVTFDTTPSSPSPKQSPVKAKSVDIEEDISSGSSNSDINFDDDDDDFYAGLE